MGGVDTRGHEVSEDFGFAPELCDLATSMPFPNRTQEPAWKEARERGRRSMSLFNASRNRSSRYTTSTREQFRSRSHGSRSTQWVMGHELLPVIHTCFQVHNISLPPLNRTCLGLCLWRGCRICTLQVLKPINTCPQLLSLHHSNICRYSVEGRSTAERRPICLDA